jgi:hypothetical protein
MMWHVLTSHVHGTSMDLVTWISMCVCVIHGPCYMDKNVHEQVLTLTRKNTMYSLLRIF